MKPDMATGKTLKALGLLMAYPEAGLGAAAAEISAVFRNEGWLPKATCSRLEDFLNKMATEDLLDLQEDYVTLFDRTPSLSLHLFEHVHGDSRDRGQAMVDLDMLYREAGLHNASEHTPDFLPLFLEYLSLLPADQARDNLCGAIDVVGAIGERLKKRQSPYAVIFDALQDAARLKPDAKKLQAALEFDSGKALDRDAMDAAWEEQFALADPKMDQGGGCPRAEDMLARMIAPDEKTGARS